jgi:hypothetical protein
LVESGSSSDAAEEDAASSSSAAAHPDAAIDITVSTPTILVAILARSMEPV